MNFNYLVFILLFFLNLMISLYFDVLKEVDWSVGRILRILKECDIDNNILILFMLVIGYYFDELCDICIVEEIEDSDVIIFLRGKIGFF